MGRGVFDALYLLHGIVEIGLGAVKLSGTYQGVVMPENTQKFVRHHGLALISLGLLGILMFQRQLVNTEAGKTVSLSLAAFHCSVCVLMLTAMAMGPFLNHLPFAIGFLAHLVTTKGGRD